MSSGGVRSRSGEREVRGGEGDICGRVGMGGLEVWRLWGRVVWRTMGEYGCDGGCVVDAGNMGELVWSYVDVR